MEEQPQIQPSLHETPACPVCGGQQVRPVLDITGIPVLCNVLWERREDALAAPRGDVRLAFCERCGHVFNQVFDPGRLAYTVQYENSLHFSPRFQEYASWLARYLVDRYALKGKSIIEIGSGQGDFLRLLCEYGGNTGTGFDPSYDPQNGEPHPALSFVRDLYSDRYAHYQADLICSRHTLEHIEQPTGFVQNLRRAIGDRKDAVVFVEVPNLDYILRDTAIWDIIYEHVSYFGPGSLSYLFSRHGFNVLNVADAYEGQFLYIEAAPRESGLPAGDAPAGAAVAALENRVAFFAERSQAKLARWRQQLDALRSGGKRVVLWGAGSKGISFLNMLQVRDEIQFVIDINPRKRGRYITGAGQQIVPPDFLRDYQPDTILIMNPIYQQEIQSTVAGLGLRPEYLFA